MNRKSQLRVYQSALLAVTASFANARRINSVDVDMAERVMLWQLEDHRLEHRRTSIHNTTQRTGPEPGEGSLRRPRSAPATLDTLPVDTASSDDVMAFRNHRQILDRASQLDRTATRPLVYSRRLVHESDTRAVHRALATATC